MNRIPFILGLISFALYRFIYYLTDERYLSLLVFCIPLSFLLINFLLRKKLKYKQWFLSTANIFLEKKSQSIETSIPIDLLHDKLIEVVGDSGFILFDEHSEQHELLIGTSINFWTWGENMYISMEELSDEVVSVQFHSVTLYGSFSWRRNTQNYESFIAAFEQSLII